DNPSAARSDPAAAPAPVPALGTVQVPSSHAPAVPRVHVGGARIMRAIDFRDGDEIDYETVVEDFIGKLSYLEGQGFPPEGMIDKIPLARVRIDYPEERQLHNNTGSSDYNKKIDALTAGAWMPDRWTSSLVASGSFCAPAQPDYTQLVVAGRQREVANYLPTVQADRGALIVQAPLKLSDIASSATQTA